MPKTGYGSQKNLLIAEGYQVIAVIFQKKKTFLAIMIATFFLYVIYERKKKRLAIMIATFYAKIGPRKSNQLSDS